MTAKYDAILIGSGIGALTVAVGLARVLLTATIFATLRVNWSGDTGEVRPAS